MDLRKKVHLLSSHARTRDHFYDKLGKVLDIGIDPSGDCLTREEQVRFIELVLDPLVTKLKGTDSVWLVEIRNQFIEIVMNLATNEKWDERARILTSIQICYLQIPSPSCLLMVRDNIEDKKPREEELFTLKQINQVIDHLESLGESFQQKKKKL